jgi:hypothetical protein
MPNDLDTYLPIADHGVIGDLRTVALVGSDATIDWTSGRWPREPPVSRGGASLPVRPGRS